MAVSVSPAIIQRNKMPTTARFLSIWEKGTNHIQALFLFRDKLGMCVQPKRLNTLRAAIEATLDNVERTGGLEKEAQSLRNALDALVHATTAARDCGPLPAHE